MATPRATPRSTGAPAWRQTRVASGGHLREGRGEGRGEALPRHTRRAFLALAATLAAGSRAAAGTERVLALQPLGHRAPSRELAAVHEALAAFLDADLVELPLAPLPAEALYRPRRRWRAEKLLVALDSLRPPTEARILGLTTADVSTTKGAIADWGVVGLATLEGGACVVSSFRTRRGARSAAHALERLGKVAVHEVAHTLGLPHCPTPGCLLQDARGSVGTTDGERDLCARCRERLDATGWGRVGARSPWA